MDGDAVQPPGDDREAAQRRAERAEFAAELEAATEEADVSARTLADVALDRLQGGEVLRVTVAGRAWTGVVVHAGAGLLTLRTEAGVEVDVAHDALGTLRVLGPGSGGRPPGARHPAGLTQRLGELALSGEVVEVGGEGLPGGLVGRVSALAADHLELDPGDGAAWVIPSWRVGWIVRQPPARRSWAP